MTLAGPWDRQNHFAPRTGWLWRGHGITKTPLRLAQNDSGGALGSPKPLCASHRIARKAHLESQTPTTHGLTSGSCHWLLNRVSQSGFLLQPKLINPDHPWEPAALDGGGGGLVVGWPPARAPPCFSLSERAWGRPPARAPPCFSHSACVWGARPLERHSVFHSPRAPGTPTRSGTTVFLAF